MQKGKRGQNYNIIYKDYAIYFGDKFLFVGSRRECANYLNTKESTISFMASPAYYKRREEQTVYGNYLLVIKIDEGDVEYDLPKFI